MKFEIIIKRIKSLIVPQHYRFSSIKTVIGYYPENYFQQVKSCYANLTNPFWYYKQLINELIEIDKLQIVPLYELMSCPTNGIRIIGLRHDIDADPITGLRCARYLARNGICGSFYFLFTSPYYGTLYDRLFLRNPKLSEWIRDYIVSGCEIGIHNDCLKLYLDHDINGIDFLKQEIEWFRSNGVNVRGTVAHNSGTTYGAENSEIFLGRVLWDRKLVSRKGKLLRLGSVSEKDIGLSYEGSFVKRKKDIDISNATRFFSNKKNVDIRSKSWMRQYLLENPCLDWQLNYQFWLIGRDNWVVSGKHEDKVLFEWEIGINRVLDIIKSLPKGSRSVIVLHPSYVRQNT